MRRLRVRHVVFLAGIAALAIGAVLAFGAIRAQRAHTDVRKSISTLGALDLSVLEQLNQVRLTAGLVALQTFASVGAAYAYVIRRRIRAFFASKQKSPSEVLPAATDSSDREVA